MIFHSQKTVRVPEIPVHEAIFFNISDYEDKVALVRTWMTLVYLPVYSIKG